MPDKDLCAAHENGDKWRQHGLVTGPIPEKKLQDFLKAACAAKAVEPTVVPGDGCEGSRVVDVSSEGASATQQSRRESAAQKADERQALAARRGVGDVAVAERMARRAAAREKLDSVTTDPTRDNGAGSTRRRPGEGRAAHSSQRGQQ